MLYVVKFEASHPCQSHEARPRIMASRIFNRVIFLSSSSAASHASAATSIPMVMCQYRPARILRLPGIGALRIAISIA